MSSPVGEGRVGSQGQNDVLSLQKIRATRSYGSVKDGSPLPSIRHPKSVICHFIIFIDKKMKKNNLMRIVGRI